MHRGDAGEWRLDHPVDRRAWQRARDIGNRRTVVDYIAKGGSLDEQYCCHSLELNHIEPSPAVNPCR
jgi:hypothetical protein